MGPSSTLQRNLLNNLPGVTAGCEGKDTITRFPTMIRLRPFDKQKDVRSESGDSNLMFPSAKAEIKSIYIQDVFSDSDSM